MEENLDQLVLNKSQGDSPFTTVQIVFVLFLFLLLNTGNASIKKVETT